jgi:outer membrane protein OmpA-like peptidoglycan-associated protein
MIAVGSSPWVAPVKVTICLAVICGVVACSSTPAVRTGAAGPDAAHRARAGTAAAAPAVSPASLSAQQAALRTSLASTAVVIASSSKALELWYPVRLAFAPDSTELLSTATVMLDLLARSLSEYEHTAIVVAVYTDAIGSNDYNQQQSQTRAAAVVAYLESKGVAAARLVARGVGESAPLEAPANPEGRDLNRRLQVVITPLS